MFVVDEAIFRKYKVFPLKLMAWEGVFGAPLYMLMLVIIQCIPCEGKLCPNGHLENSLMALRQMRENPKILIIQLALMVSICLCLCFSMSVIKWSSAISRTTVDSTRTVIVWIFFMLWPKDRKNHESFHYLQLIGFLVLLFGSLLYNEVIVIKYLGFSNNLSKKEKRV